jgi:hypothetical protein
MRMSGRNESFPNVSAPFLLARMSVSEESNLSPFETQTHEDHRSIDARWRPWPETLICAGRGGSMARPPLSGGPTHLRIGDTAGQAPLRPWLTLLVLKDAREKQSRGGGLPATARAAERGRERGRDKLAAGYARVR